MATIFTRIVNGEIPCHKVAETADYLAFLDIRPQAKGHTLCIPKREVDYIFDLEDEALAGLLIFAKKVAKALRQAVPCKRIGIAVIGIEVPHAHVHLIPLNAVSDIAFKEPLDIPANEMAELAAKIAALVEGGSRKGFDFFDRMNKIYKIYGGAAASFIRSILFILSKTILLRA